jgi:RNA polymerase sigma factor (sigma-70 family)
MTSTQKKLIEDHLPLADLIALEYANIPGSLPEEARSEAHFALVRAAQAFDADRGEFMHLASRAVRNRLNTFYAKHLRLAKLFPKSLDDAVNWRKTGAGIDPSSDGQSPVDPKADVLREVRKNEAGAALKAVMNLLSPREQLVVGLLRAGKSYAEMAEEVGVSKQAVHKSTQSALSKLREGLERLGYRGVASDGALGSS